MKTIVTLLIILQQTVSFFHVSLGSPAEFPDGHDSYQAQRGEDGGGFRDWHKFGAAIDKPENSD